MNDMIVKSLKKSKILQKKEKKKKSVYSLI